MTAKKANSAKSKAADTTIAVDASGHVAGLKQVNDVELSRAAHTLERLEQARKLPIVSPGAPVERAVMAPGSIEAFRTEDGKTMLVVLHNGELAAKELSDAGPPVRGETVELKAGQSDQPTEGDAA